MQWILVILMAILAVVLWFCLVGRAFKKHPAWGIGSLLFPIVQFLFVVTNWRAGGNLFLAMVLCIVISVGAMIINPTFFGTKPLQTANYSSPENQTSQPMIGQRRHMRGNVSGMFGGAGGGKSHSLFSGFGDSEKSEDGDKEENSEENSDEKSENNNDE
jgi:hypothetical protein